MSEYRWMVLYMGDVGDIERVTEDQCEKRMKHAAQLGFSAGNYPGEPYDLVIISSDVLTEEEAEYVFTMFALHLDAVE
jgi:hypothetical protein